MKNLDERPRERTSFTDDCRMNFPRSVRRGTARELQRQKSASAPTNPRDSPLGIAAGGNRKTFTTRIMT